MTLSTSRQQFLAFEGQSPEEIQYGRKGGVFISSCVCACLVLLAIVAAALIGIGVYYVTYYKLSQNASEFWNENEPFGLAGDESPDLRLPTDVVPSYYRLKIKADLDNSTFSGDVSITIRANKRVKEITLHSKDLTIQNNAKLTEQIYEKVQLYGGRTKRAAEEDAPKLGPDNAEIPENTKPSSTENSKENKTASGITISEKTPTQTNQTELTTIATSTEKPVTTTEAAPAETTPLPSNETIIIPDGTIIVEVPKPINEVTLSNMRNIKILSVSHASGDRLILSLASALKTGVDYTLELSFEGKISDTLTGFYKSTYNNSKNEVKTLGVTQFEPTSARAAFPCFDEPQLKAMFEISIAHDKRMKALSNMKLATEEDLTDVPGWQWSHFERSVRMSTYLVAFLVSQLSSLQDNYYSQDNTTKTIRVWARPELIEKAQYALSIAKKLLVYYEDLFGVPYALDKLDLVAIPDFSSGAMENWGLVTFRETTLLFDNTGGPREKQNVCVDVAHELAHQWFGNLVTMRWWDDLWLNEGFATYIEYVGVDKIEPEWRMFDSLVRDKLDLLRLDALKNTPPVARRVADAAEITQKFDEISYSKGANLIRMLNHTVGGQAFHDGLRAYLNKWKYSNAEENDLWASMSSGALSDGPPSSGPPTPGSPSSGAPVVQFMNSWTRQAGYPVVKVNRDYETGEADFKQRLFTTSANPYKSMEEQIWQIPITYKTIDSTKNEPILWLKERAASFPLNISAGDPLYVNVDAIGYYRVNYDAKNWDLLRLALRNSRVPSPTARAQLIDDAYNLAKVGLLDYEYALDITTYVIDGENSKIVWDMLLNNLAFLRHNLKTTSGYVYFQEFAKLLIAKQLKSLNYGLDKPKDDNEAFLIESLLAWECAMESERCVQWALGEFEAWDKRDLDDNPIPPHLRSLVYSVSLRAGGPRPWRRLWALAGVGGGPGAGASRGPTAASLALAALPSTLHEDLIVTLLEKSLTEIPKQYAATVWNFDSTVGVKIAQDFFIENWDRIHAAFNETDSFIFPGVMRGAFGVITTKDELDKLKSFAMQHKEALLPISQTIQNLVDNAELRINWRRAHSQKIIAWLKNYMEKAAQPKVATSNKNSTMPKITLNSNSEENPVNITASNTTASITTTNNTDILNGNPKNDSAVPATNMLPTKNNATNSSKVT